MRDEREATPPASSPSLRLPHPSSLVPRPSLRQLPQLRLVQLQPQTRPVGQQDVTLLEDERLSEQRVQLRALAGEFLRAVAAMERGDDVKVGGGADGRLRLVGDKLLVE